VFVNGEGFIVGLQEEAPPRGGLGGSGGGPSPPPPRTDQDEDESDDVSSEGEWKHRRRMNDREQNRDKDKEPDARAGTVGSKSVGVGSHRVPPTGKAAAAVTTALGSPIFQYGLNLGRVWRDLLVVGRSRLRTLTFLCWSWRRWVRT
jgi:hypothetical protein